MEGKKLKNPRLINYINNKGEKMTDWAKKSISTQKGQIHYYENLKTGEVFYDIDYKFKGL